MNALLRVLRMNRVAARLAAASARRSPRRAAQLLAAAGRLSAAVGCYLRTEEGGRS